MQVDEAIATVASETVWRARRRVRPRRPWILVIACLLLVLLSSVLWAKWRESRYRAMLLAAELKQIYGEAERLRSESAQARQRIGQLERQLRALSVEAARPAAAIDELRTQKSLTRPAPGSTPESR